MLEQQTGCAALEKTESEQVMEEHVEKGGLPVGTRPDTDDGDGVALKTDQDGGILDDGIDQAKSRGCGLVVSLLDLLAALEGAGVARGVTAGQSGGGESERSSRKEGDFGEHR